MDTFNLILEAIIKLFLALCVGIDVMFVVWAISNYVHHRHHYEVDENGNLVSY